MMKEIRFLTCFVVAFYFLTIGMNLPATLAGASESSLTLTWQMDGSDQEHDHDGDESHDHDSDDDHDQAEHPQVFVGAWEWSLEKSLEMVEDNEQFTEELEGMSDYVSTIADHFKEDGTFESTMTNAEGQSETQTGTWSATQDEENEKKYVLEITFPEQNYTAKLNVEFLEDNVISIAEDHGDHSHAPICLVRSTEEKGDE